MTWNDANWKCFFGRGKAHAEKNVVSGDCDYWSCSSVCRYRWNGNDKNTQTVWKSFELISDFFSVSLLEHDISPRTLIWCRWNRASRKVKAFYITEYIVVFDKMIFFLQKSLCAEDKVVSHCLGSFWGIWACKAWYSFVICREDVCPHYSLVVLFADLNDSFQGPGEKNVEKTGYLWYKDKHGLTQFSIASIGVCADKQVFAFCFV